MKALAEIGYDGYVSVEYEGPFFGGFTDDAETIARESLHFVEKLLGSVGEAGD
jgi:sugar phosphate isomerase/epimerase